MCVGGQVGGLRIERSWKGSWETKSFAWLLQEVGEPQVGCLRLKSPPMIFLFAGFIYLKNCEILPFGVL